MTEAAAAEAVRRRMSSGRPEKEERKTEPVNFFEQISWSPAMPKFMTSLPKLESQKQSKGKATYHY